MTTREVNKTINVEADYATHHNGDYPLYRRNGASYGIPIVRSRLTKINGGIDDALFITLKSGGEFVAFTDEIELP